MPPVALEIIQPAIADPSKGVIVAPPEHAMSGAGLAVLLRGRFIGTDHPPLFVRWYSTLNPATSAQRVALNWDDVAPHAQVPDFAATLGVGTHVITLAAKDQLADTTAAVAQVVYAGMAGGPIGAEHPCLLHVLLALLPVDQPTSISRASALLQAVAPFKWNNDDYKLINKIVYRWRLVPRGNPPRPTVAVPTPVLSFIQGDATQATPLLPKVQFQGPLPAGVLAGTYTLVLRVEHADQPDRGHEATRDLIVT